MESFDLHIDLGSDAMQTPQDVAQALRAVAERLDAGPETDGAIRDTNGNKVGYFGQ